MKKMAILGGTFDPIHHAHLQIAQRLHDEYQFQEIRFIPCKNPVLKRKAFALSEHRIAMLQLALEDYSYCTLDLREILRDTPSYTLETLVSLKQDFPQHELSLVMGYDAFSSFDKWYQWQELIRYCKILVVDRKTDVEISDTLRKFIHLQENISVFFLHFPIDDIASTRIRHLIQTHQALGELAPKKVQKYIKKFKLYG